MRSEAVPGEDRPSAPPWGVDAATIERWAELTPGTTVTIVKRSVAQHGPDFRVAYPGTVLATDLPPPWVVLEARWVAGTIHQAHLTFENDDVLWEVFSPIHPYNAFAVYTPDGDLKGWYANTVHPTTVVETNEGLEVIWDDLFLDIVATPDGRVAVLDEDELAASGLALRDPTLHARILAARDEILARFHTRQPPFATPARLSDQSS